MYRCIIINLLLYVLISCSSKAVDLSHARGRSNSNELFPHAKINNIRLPLSRDQELVIVKGRCVFSLPKDEFKYPLKFVPLKLLKNGIFITETTTDGAGFFTFSEKLSIGKYEVLIQHPKFSGKKIININRKIHDNIILEASAI